MSILSARGLVREFGGIHAVDGVDFELPDGQITALIGPNGAGKSTFVGLLVGRIAPTAGRVFFAGRDISSLPAHARIRLGIAYTFQITSIFPGLSVHENVALAARRAVGHDRAGVARRVDEALGRVGLEGREGAIAGDMSYGHQRLLEIAMGLAQKPRVFILDEPTQGLAPDEIDGFLDLMRGLRGQTSILLIEHNMDVVMALADRIAVLAEGRLIAEGEPAAIRANRDVQEAYLGAVDA